VQILLYGVPIGFGVLLGYVLTWQVNFILAGVAGLVGGGLLWSTRNAELGSLIGVIAAIEAALFVIPLLLVTVGVNGFAPVFDFSWLLRVSASLPGTTQP